MYDSVVISAFWKIMSQLPSFILRRVFTKQDLANKIRIDVRPRHTAVQVVGQHLPNATVWLVIQNSGHFAVELDRLTAELNLAGCYVQLVHLERIPFKGGSQQELYLKTNLTLNQIEHYARHLTGDVSLSVHAEFNSVIHDFAVRTGNLTGIKPETPGVVAPSK